MELHLPMKRVTFRNMVSTVYFCPGEADGAILFVHGFGGDPVGTWAIFPNFALRDLAFRRLDLIFFRYDGLKTPAQVSANRLREFLHKALDNHDWFNSLLDPSGQRPRDFRYQKVLIVAHSLGSIVTRRALADAVGTSWAKSIAMLLFAPAHMGANIVRLAYEALTGIQGVGAVVSAALRARYLPLLDLEERSQTLELLRNDVSRLTAAGANAHLRALRVVIAERDRIVAQNAFPGDPTSETAYGVGHSAVCKPRRDYTDPLDQVKACL